MLNRTSDVACLLVLAGCAAEETSEPRDHLADAVWAVELLVATQSPPPVLAMGPGPAGGVLLVLADPDPRVVGIDAQHAVDRTIPLPQLQVTRVFSRPGGRISVVGVSCGEQSDDPLPLPPGYCGDVIATFDSAGALVELLAPAANVQHVSPLDDDLILALTTVPGAPLDLGGGAIESASRLVLARIGGGGGLVWAHGFAAQQEGGVVNVALAADDRQGIVIAGRPLGVVVDLGDGQLFDDTTSFVARFDGSGALTAARALPGLGAYGHQVDVAESGRVAVFTSGDDPSGVRDEPPTFVLLDPELEAVSEVVPARRCARAAVVDGEGALIAAECATGDVYREEHETVLVTYDDAARRIASHSTTVELPGDSAFVIFPSPGEVSFAGSGCIYGGAGADPFDCKAWVGGFAVAPAGGAFELR